jgi:hypothetical protein
MAFVSGDRRRRVLTEQIVTGAAGVETSATASSGAAKSEPTVLAAAYEPDTLERLARVTDLVPHRRSFFVLWWFALVALGSGLVALHLYSPGWSKVLSVKNLETLSLTAPSGLGRWFSTVLLLIAAGLSSLIYAVRRHRTDDYQGRYRLWATAALCWLLLSLFSSTGTSEVLRELGIRYTAWQGWRSGALWWLVPLATVYGLAILRMSLDMRRAPFSFLTLLLATASWLSAMSMEFGWITASFAPQKLVEAGLMMTGHLLLVGALLSYARLVVLQAAGKIAAVAIPRKKKDDATAKKKRRTKSVSKSVAKTKVATKTNDHKSPSTTDEEDDSRFGRTGTRAGSTGAGRSAAARLTLGRRADEEDDDNEDEDSLDGRQKLSKADRKRLRRERTKENRAA